MLYLIILLLILIFLFKSNENFENSSVAITSESISNYSNCNLIDDEDAKGKIVTFELGNGYFKTTCDFGEPVNNTCSTISTKCAEPGDCIYDEHIRLETTINGETRCRKYPYSDPFTIN